MAAMAEHILILLRHAKSDWSGGYADLDRPLSPRGRRQAPETGRWLAQGVGPIDRAVVSPAARARGTWDLVAAELPVPPEVSVDERAYAATGAELLRVLSELPEQTRTVVLVGHNPGLEELAEQLTGEWVRLPTSAVAVVAVPGPWADLPTTGATLQAAGRPPAGPVSGTPQG